MRVRYKNCDNTISYGKLVGRGKAWDYRNCGFNAPVMSPTVHIVFDDTNGDPDGGERVETLFADDHYLTLNVFKGSHASTLRA